MSMIIPTTNLHPICEKCISRARDKYNGFTDNDGERFTDGFAVNCNFLPADENFIDQATSGFFADNPEMLSELNCLQTPLLWAMKYLRSPDTGRPWTPRPAQIAPLLCRAPRRVLRFGRRCLPGETLILLADNTEKPIQEIVPGDTVVSFEIENTFLRRKNSQILSLWENGIQGVYRISFNNGRFLECTNNHPLLAQLGGVPTWLSINQGLLPGISIFSLTAFGYKKLQRIDSIQYSGQKETFDLEVENTHNFIANRFIVHNSGKSVLLTIEILWTLFTSNGGMLDPVSNQVRRNIEILFVAPNKPHISSVFEKLKQFIDASPLLREVVSRQKRGSPEELWLYGKDGTERGNKIVGFAGGEHSGSKGVSARGQDADKIIMDEAAFISSNVVIDVIRPILATRPTTSLLISSTPNLPGDEYEKYCTQSPQFVEFYSPTTEVPNFQKELEPILKKDFAGDQEKWDHEILALFSVAGSGVFRDDLIKGSQMEYSFSKMRRNNSLIYTFGIDWNREHGTEIAIVGTERREPHISWLVYAENIPKKAWSALAGVERVVALNRIWEPTWIFPDDGGSEGGVNLLKLHGYNNIGKNIVDARLKDIVEAFDSGSSIPLLNHATGEEKKYYAKQLMIEHFVRKLEIGEFRYPAEEILLTRQMQGYVIHHRTQRGQPIYQASESKVGDHRLDAVALALVALRLKYSSFYEAGIFPMKVNIIQIPEVGIKQERKLPSIAIVGSGRKTNGYRIGNRTNETNFCTAEEFFRDIEPKKTNIGRSIPNARTLQKHRGRNIF